MRSRQASCDTPAMSVSLQTCSQTLSHFSWGDLSALEMKAASCPIIKQLMVEHNVIGVLSSFVSLSMELLQGFLMLFIQSLVIWQDAVGCIPDHTPYIDVSWLLPDRSTVHHLKP